jgi:hypothetical protein
VLVVFGAVTLLAGTATLFVLMPGAATTQNASGSVTLPPPPAGMARRPGLPL